MIIHKNKFHTKKENIERKRNKTKEQTNSNELAPSTWSGILCFNAIDAISSISSITPCGYVGADTTISNTSIKKKQEVVNHLETIQIQIQNKNKKYTIMVFLLRDFLIAFTSAR